MEDDDVTGRARKLRAGGKTYREIADIVGMSKDWAYEKCRDVDVEKKIQKIEPSGSGKMDKLYSAFLADKSPLQVIAENIASPDVVEREYKRFESMKGQTGIPVIDNTPMMVSEINRALVKTYHDFVLGDKNVMESLGTVITDKLTEMSKRIETLEKLLLIIDQEIDKALEKLGIPRIPKDVVKMFLDADVNIIEKWMGGATPTPSDTLIKEASPESVDKEE